MSEFLKRTDGYTAEHPSEIDFDDAVKLPEGGSTCDIYRTKWQRRDVFVKRLKEQYRSKPLYLDALDKEFDIGVSLKHPSLPEYREFHRDYIVLDYIDGMTLAEMIKHHDPWLSNEKHIVGMLRELVDVVGYLHRHNVVHCDIKPDNIMITANSRNLVLIDFDKCYTDALSDTSGHPRKYGLTADEPGRVAIDFRGIGMVVEKLKANIPGFKFTEYKKFLKACYNPNVNSEELMDILSGSAKEDSTSLKEILVFLLGFGGLGIIITLIAFMGKTIFEDTDNYDDDPMNEITTVEIIEAAPSDSMTVDIETESGPTSESDYKAPEHVSRTQEEIHAEAKERAAMLDKRIQPYFDELIAGLNHLKKLKMDTAYTSQQLLDSIRKHGDRADEYIAEAFAILNDMYPGITDREAWRVMAYSKAYTGYTRRATPEGKEYRDEYERRAKEEGTIMK